MYNEIQTSKKEYLEKLNASVRYRSKNNPYVQHIPLKGNLRTPNVTDRKMESVKSHILMASTAASKF